ncbi:phytoene/squalene synthase family protein [Gordonia crocea]|uniref:Phytoene synthase n=1 Tax=Gordonia crocea TaxID=589162 RepID=A0A7I9UYP1_9ACTN|nr:phytoene/squalene synthase family protein [Gordonia crocea]GED98288.1 phytoene synthase [Gordonia crocea]
MTADRGYRVAESLSAIHGRTYHLASRLLPAPQRRAVHALYGFARTADDIVDLPVVGPDDRLARLDALFAGLDATRSGGPIEIDRSGGPIEIDRSGGPIEIDRSGGPIDVRLPPDTIALLAAVADASQRFGLTPGQFAAFHHSMRMDLPAAPEFTDRYRDMAHLREYTRGSAAVIGEMLVPLLGADATRPDTLAHAGALGEAFQLTNFLRDVGEDLDRNRIYLPADELAAFGVDEAGLRACRERARVSRPVRRAIAHLVAVNRDWYRRADAGIEDLPRRTRPAIRAAARSYADILRVIEERGYDVFAGRAVVPARTRVRHAVAALF